MKAGLVKWYNCAFPKHNQAFDSPIPHQNSMKKLLISIFLLLALAPTFVLAQDGALIQNKEEIFLAKVTEIVSQETTLFPGTNQKVTYQKIKATILEGEKEGENLTSKD